MSQLWQFVALLGGHFVADFVCQSHWMASNKSKDNEALAVHIGVYSCAMLTLALMLFARSWWTLALVLVFIGLNGALHFATDYLTSRWSSKLWAQQRWHDFFVIIGFDQLIHQVTLAVLMALIFGGAA